MLKSQNSLHGLLFKNKTPSLSAAKLLSVLEEESSQQSWETWASQHQPAEWGTTV